MLQRHALLCQPLSVKLRQGDLLKHRPNWASSPNRWPPLKANRKPPRAAASSAESTSLWTASSGHPLTPPTPLQAPPVYYDARRPLHCRRRTLLWPLTSASSTLTVRHRGTASVVSHPLCFTSSELHSSPPYSRPPLSPAWLPTSWNFGRRRYRRHRISLPCYSNGPAARVAGLAQNRLASDGPYEQYTSSFSSLFSLNEIRIVHTSNIRREFK
jgi:hypothetical protein